MFARLVLEEPKKRSDILTEETGSYLEEYDEERGQEVATLHRNLGGPR